MKKETQLRKIRQYLESGNSITALGAYVHFGCARLSARIYDLKKAGVPIVSNTIQYDGKRVAKYSIEYKSV